MPPSEDEAQEEYRALSALHSRVLGMCHALRRTTPVESEYAALLVKLLTEIDRRYFHIGYHQKLNPKLKSFLDELEHKLQAVTPAHAKALSEKEQHGNHLSHDDMKDIMSKADEFLYGQAMAERFSKVVSAAPAPPMLYVDTWGIQRGPWRDQIEHIHNVLLVNPHLSDWIQPSEIQKWMNQCEEQHSDHCGPAATSDDLFPHRPRRLLDVQDMCIILAGSDSPYIALSYVWGTGSSLKSLKHSLDLLLTGAPLESNQKATPSHSTPKTFVQYTTDKVWHVIPDSLPPTIQHVIELVRRIGHRYLWIDSLCIVQDDEVEKAQELSRMGSIYANAHLTIVAANGNAYTGLHGIEGITPPMERPSKTPLYLRAPKAASKEVEDAHNYIMRSSWNQRAWTFQEQIFSRRLLVVSEARITWECHCAVWFEGLDALQERCKVRRRVIPGLSFGETASMDDYGKHVAAYNRRNLTYPEDALDAFAGILGTLTGIFDGGFVCGLPRLFFDTALLWYNESPLELRKPVKESSKSAMPPTWSWAAWSGIVKFPEDKITPLANWWYRAHNSIPWKQMVIRTQDGSEPTGPPSLEDCAPHLLYAKVQRVFFAGVESDFDHGLYLKGSTEDVVGLITPCGPVPSAPVKHFEVVAVSETTINDSIAINILWVEREGLTAYRRGVGRVLKSVWELEQPEVVDLFLG